MMDECVGHMTEKVVIPPADEIEIVPRRLTQKPPGEFLPYAVNGEPVPEFARAGDGYRFHTTGLTHDERGYPVMSAECQEKCVRRLVDKIRSQRRRDRPLRGGRHGGRRRGRREPTASPPGWPGWASSWPARRGSRSGFIRLIVVWPFPEKRIRELAGKVKAFVVPEINYGQMVLEVERCAGGKAAAVLVPHAGGGVHDPEDICEAIVGAAK